MKKSTNHYRVTDKGWTIARQIKSFDDTLAVVNFILTSRNFPIEEDISLFFKPNRTGIQVIPYPTNQIVELDHPDNDLINKILTKLKIFNGKALKYNAIELLNPRYKPNTYQPADVRFAESVNFNKGKSVIFDKKYKEYQFINDTDTANKLNRLNANQGTLQPLRGIEDIVRVSLSQIAPSVLYRKLRGNTSLSNKELNRLIYKYSHQ